MKYLKYFEELSAYEAYKNGSDFITPNVSYIEEIKGVSYIPKVEEPTQTYNMVDLGLPSGLLWADRNIGASSPEDFGLYFQWGDTVGYTAEQVANGEKVFNWDSYFDTTNHGSTFIKYTTSNEILQPEDDAATVNMGSEYRMPAKEDFKELINNTTVTYIDIYDNEYEPVIVSGMLEPGTLKGIKFTGSNGNVIFIPASGIFGRSNDDLFTEANLWCNKSLPKEYASAQIFDINGEMFYGDRNSRYRGLVIRGVK